MQPIASTDIGKPVLVNDTTLKIIPYQDSKYLTFLKDLSFPGWDCLASQKSFKYVDYDSAYKHSVDFIRTFLDTTPFHHDYTYCVVDVKIIDLEKNNYPCLPPWHYDCVRNLNHPSKIETHYIWQFGAECFTRFCLGHDLTKDPVVIIEPEKIYKYNRTYHAPSRAQASGRRILLRKTFTDIVKPTKVY